ncbi:MAG: c-type cytochrome domain-containing protein [Planctomycetota bacterium]|nr:c-type cytochrome domain-containing protein [Planctomycetota bacterium]
MIRPVLLSILVLAAVSCGGSSGGTSAPVTPNEKLRKADSQTGGADGDDLAAALLLSTDRPAYRVGRSKIEMSNAGLEDQVLAFARLHLQVRSSGAAPGPSLASSATLVRKASESDAPADNNGNGSNIDETLAAELMSFAAMTGGELDPGTTTRLFTWRRGSSDYAGSGADSDVTRTTLTVAEGEVSLAQMARAMRARTLLGTGLLQRNRGSRPGETPEEGVLGLFLLRQALAIEETLFSNLFMNGLVPGPLQFPSDYDPANGVRWLPNTVEVRNARPDGVGPNSYRVLDVASSLETVAAMLRAGGELSYYAGSQNPNPNLRDIFRGSPFGPDPGSGRGAASANQIVTWESGVSEVLSLWCAGCHRGLFGQAGFAVDSYEAVHRGGVNSKPGSKTPIITRGDPDNSVLYYILKANPPAPFIQMPQGGQFPAKELQLIKDWITDGARSAPPGPPAIGFDLAVVSYKNLVALHLDSSGALNERNDLDGDPSAHVDVASTGEVLQALAVMDHLESDLPDYLATLQKIADFAVDQLCDSNGVVVGTYDIAAQSAGEAADLLEHARIAAGLLAAGRVLKSSDIEARGKAVGRHTLDEFFDAAGGLFRSNLREIGRRYSVLELAAVVDMLREMAQAGITDAVATHETFLSRLLPVLVYSETEATGETVGDEIPDTDGDGIPEPAHAGGDFGRAPMFVGQIKEGPELEPGDGPILWSTHILPLFQANCAQCHLGGAKRGEYRLDTPARLRIPGTLNPGSSLVVPGDPEASYLYRKLVDRTPAAGDQMPLQQAPLSAHAKELVRLWILQGASAR